MEALVKQACLFVDVLGPQVEQGRYDLIGPNGDIVLPQFWEMAVKPDWAVTMHMWPIPEPLPCNEPPQAPRILPFQRPRKSAPKKEAAKRPSQIPPPPPPGAGMIGKDQTDLDLLTSPTAKKKSNFHEVTKSTAEKLTPRVSQESNCKTSSNSNSDNDSTSDMEFDDGKKNVEDSPVDE